MSKTIRLSDVARDLRNAKKEVEEDARNEARFRVIEAKRRLCGRAVAWVDGERQYADIEARSDVRVR